MVWKVAEPGDDGIEHRNIDKLTAIGFFSLVKGKEDAQGCIHSRGDIGDRQTGTGGFVRIAGGGNDSSFSLDEEIIGLYVAVGTVLTIAGERAIDETWIHRVKGFVAKAKAPRDPGSIILEENVGSFGQFLKHRSAFFLFDNACETALDPIELNITRAQPVNHRATASYNGTHAWMFDFDNYRDHVGEQTGGKRSGKRLLKDQDLYAVQCAAGFGIGCHCNLFY